MVDAHQLDHAYQLIREQLLFRYSLAVERNDRETVAHIVRQAETDPTLQRMLQDWHKL